MSGGSGMGEMLQPLDVVRQRFGWAVRVRWMVIGGYLSLGLGAWFAGVLVDPRPCLLAGAAAATLNGLNSVALSRGGLIRLASLAAMAGDLVLITYLVVRTGGMGSPFLSMYLVQVLASGMLVEVWVGVAGALVGLATLVLALSTFGADASVIFVGAAYYTPVWFLFFGYSLAMVSYVGGYVSRQLRQREEALEGSNRRLRRALAELGRAHDDLGSTVRRLEATERQLVHSEKMRSLGEFVAGVAHELNNPIAIVTANVELLELAWAGNQALVGSDASELVVDIKEAARRAARVVADLRQFSHAGANRTWAAVDLAQRIQRAVELARHLLGSEVWVDVELPSLPPVHAVADELDQVILNLLSNAARSMEGRGRVRIGGIVHLDSETVDITVEDDGPGVPRGLRQRVFEPFFSTRPEGEGVGLGLSLSFAIIERHGGSMRVEDSSLGGARMVVSLPIGPSNGVCSGLTP